MHWLGRYLTGTKKLDKRPALFEPACLVPEC